MTARAAIDSFEMLPENDEDSIRNKLLEGPVAVGVCGSEKSFLFYSHGVYRNSECCTVQNHAMLLVSLTVVYVYMSCIEIPRITRYQ